MIVMIKQERSFIREKMCLHQMLPANVHNECTRINCTKTYAFICACIVITLHLKLTFVLSLSLSLIIMISVQSFQVNSNASTRFEHVQNQTWCQKQFRHIKNQVPLHLYICYMNSTWPMFDILFSRFIFPF